MAPERDCGRAYGVSRCSTVELTTTRKPLAAVGPQTGLGTISSGTGEPCTPEMAGDPPQTGMARSGPNPKSGEPTCMSRRFLSHHDSSRGPTAHLWDVAQTHDSNGYPLGWRVLCWYARGEPRTQGDIPGCD